MPRIPDTPEEIFSEFSENVKSAFGDELVSIVLFGSGAKGEYLPGKSDINLLIVLSEKGIDALDKGLELVEKWRKMNVGVPLFFTEDYITSALDTFPIEFLDMKNFHKPVYGKDVLSALEINHDDLRRQIERELRGKLVYLRTGFLSTGNERKRMREMLSASVAAFISIFEGLLYLKGKQIPEKKTEVIKDTAELFKLDMSVFANVLNVRTGQWRGSTVQLRDVTLSYIREVRKLVKAVDKM